MVFAVVRGNLHLVAAGELREAMTQAATSDVKILCIAGLDLLAGLFDAGGIILYEFDLRELFSSRLGHDLRMH